MATVYTVLLDGDETSLFDYFLSENAEKYPDEVQSILKRLREIGSSTGAREKFFKHDEGIPGTGFVRYMMILTAISGYTVSVMDR